MTSSNQVLDGFRRRHPLRPPGWTPEPSEAVRLNASDGLMVLQPAPATNVIYGTPPKSRSDKTNKYLWVIDERGVPYVFEVRVARIGALPKHTNLTGGGAACLGGEMWFESNTALYISGASGRYPPKNATQLEEAIQVFKSFGYRVDSLGWDEEQGWAKRLLETS